MYVLFISESYLEACGRPGKIHDLRLGKLVVFGLRERLISDVHRKQIIYVCMYVCLYVYVCVSLYVRMYACMHACK